MLSPFEDTGEEEALTEVEFRLNVYCSQEETLSVTSNDLELDPAHEDVKPIGALLFAASLHCPLSFPPRPTMSICSYLLVQCRSCTSKLVEIVLSSIHCP